MNNIENQVNNNTIQINYPLTMEEINLLKNVNNKEINIDLDKWSDFTSLKTFVEQCTNNIEIKFNKNVYNSFNNFLFQDVNFWQKFPNIKIYNKQNLRNDNLSYYLENELILESIIKPAKDFSPFEKYIYAYNITKRFKEYKEDNENPEEARDLYSLLNNEYCVCYGYASLLQNLLFKLDIPSEIISVIFNRGVSLEEQKSFSVNNGVGPTGYHERLLVNLVDNKYKINGIYFSDPTWDNHLTKDAYNYMLMSSDEYNKNHNYNCLVIDAIELFFVHNEKEFDEKFNFLTNRVNNSNDFIFEEVNSYEYIMKGLINKIKNLDQEYYNFIKSRYPNIDSKDLNIKLQTYEEIYLSIRKYVVSKTNKPINYEQLKAGITFIYQNTYEANEMEIEQMVDEVMQMNAIRQEKVFPNRKIMDYDGNITYQDYMENKFSPKR